MSLFCRLFKKKAASSDDLLHRLEELPWENDYLAEAAREGQKSILAKERGDFDAAWGYLHEMQRIYALHASKSGFTPSEALALAGSCHRGMARLLKDEGRHDEGRHDEGRHDEGRHDEGRHAEALTHWMYACSTDSRPSKNEMKHYRPFFNRCKFNEVQLEELTSCLQEWRSRPDFRTIQMKVAEWQSL